MGIVEFDGSELEAYGLTMRLNEAGWVARLVRGSAMKNVAGLYGEFCAAFQFPPYFGMNGNAFVDSMTDLPGVSATTAGIATVIIQADAFLSSADEGHFELGDFLDLMHAVAQRYDEPISQGEQWDRPALNTVTFLQGLSSRRCDWPEIPSWSASHTIEVMGL